MTDDDTLELNKDVLEPNENVGELWEYLSSFQKKQRSDPYKELRERMKNNALNMKKDKLLEICEQFIKDNHISCDKTVYENPYVTDNVYQFINDICKIVGYYNKRD